MKERKRKENKRKTEASHLNDGGGRSHLASKPASGKDFSEYLFSSGGVRITWRMCVCAREGLCVLKYRGNRENTYTCVCASVSAYLLQGTLIYI